MSRTDDFANQKFQHPQHFILQMNKPEVQTSSPVMRPESKAMPTESESLFNSKEQTTCNTIYSNIMSVFNRFPSTL